MTISAENSKTEVSVNNFVSRICSSNQQNIPPYPPPPFNMNNYCSFSSQDYVVGYSAHPCSYPPPPPSYSYGNPFNNPPSYPPQSPYPQPYGYWGCLPSNAIIPNDRTTLLEQPCSGDYLLPKIGWAATTRNAQPFNTYGHVNDHVDDTRKPFSTEEVRTLRIPLLIIFCFRTCLLTHHMIFLSTNNIVRQRI